MGRIHECLGTLRVLLARVVLLENGEIYTKRMFFMVCESLETLKSIDSLIYINGDWFRVLFV